MYMWRSLCRECRTKVKLWDRGVGRLDCIINETCRVDSDLRYIAKLWFGR